MSLSILYLSLWPAAFSHSEFTVQSWPHKKLECPSVDLVPMCGSLACGYGVEHIWCSNLSSEMGACRRPVIVSKEGSCADNPDESSTHLYCFWYHCSYNLKHFLLILASIIRVNYYGPSCVCLLSQLPDS